MLTRRPYPIRNHYVIMDRQLSNQTVLVRNILDPDLQVSMLMKWAKSLFILCLFNYDKKETWHEIAV